MKFTPEQAWDAVLPLEGDVRGIVSQAVRANRVQPDYSVTDGMSYCVELLLAAREPIRDVTAYVLASLRRELLFDLAHVTDALDRAQLTGTATAINEAIDGDENGEDSAKANERRIETLENRDGRVAGLQVDFRCVEGLSALEKRVAGLQIAGMTHRRIAASVGCKPTAVARIFGAAMAKIRRMPAEKKTAISRRINELREGIER